MACIRIICGTITIVPYDNIIYAVDGVGADGNPPT
jgi:hypothetical protein